MAMTPNGYGRFIGRVGGLAVALGIGAAIANSPGIARADDGQSSSSESSSSDASSSSSSSSNSAPSPSASATGDSSPTSVENEPASDGATAGTATSTSSSHDDESDTPKLKSTVTAQTVTISADEPEEKSTATAPPDDPDAPAESLALLSVAGTARRAQADTSKAATSAAVTQSAAVDQSVEATAVSPLGTPEQLAAERTATETVNTLPVQLMKLFLRQGFLSAAQQQFPGGPDEKNVAELNNAVDEYAMAAAFQQQLLNPLTPTVVTQVAPPHTWYGQSVGGTRILYDNPDTIYRFMAVNKTSSYVITGRFTDGVPSDTSFSVLEGLAGTTSSILTGEDLVVAPDGTFTITVSGDPAAPGQTNHLQVTSGSTLIAARNTLADWNIEDPMSLSIERVSGPPNSLFAQLGGFALLGPLVNNIPFLTTLVSLIPPLPIAEAPLVRGTFTALILAVRGVSEQSKYMALATTDPETGQLRPPNELSPPASNAEFLANQLQSNGYFQLADDEALVVTVDPGNAGYFVVPVYNDWTITDDYWNEQTSLNNAQAVANPDGTYTLVISPTDPGVSNWVSTGGLNQGTISIRFQSLDATSTTLPTVSSQVAALDQLAAVLPPSTVYVTPQQRADQIALRKAGFNKRWAPFPQL
jgi:hypothetical protein